MYTRQKSGRQALANDRVEWMQGVGETSRDAHFFLHIYIYTYIPDGVLDAKISPTMQSKGCRELVKRRAMLTFSGAACPATPYSSGSRFYAHVIQKSGTP